MTAFDNIKTNNWPAASNEFEDFLVLKLPLNDNASLTESMPVNAGSQELFPKRTLTNAGVASLASQTGALYSSMLTIDTSVRDNTPTSNAFDGSTTTLFKWNVSGTSAGDSGTATITFNPPIQNVTQLRVHAWLNDNQYDKHGVSINNGTYVYPNIYGGDNQWHDLFDSSFSSLGFSSGGTLSKLQFRTEVDMNGQNPPSWIRAIEVNGTILQDAPGGIKKHYDNNATFDGSTTNSPQYFDLGDTGFKLNNNPWTLETWFYATSYDATIFWSGSGWNNNQGGMVQLRSSDSGVVYFQGSGGGVTSLAASNVSLNAWHHLALSANGSTVTMYIDGVSKGSATQNNSIGGFGDDFLIGAYRDTNYQPDPRYGLKGSLQDFRLYQGVAKYTSNFTPPSAILG